MAKHYNVISFFLYIPFILAQTENYIVHMDLSAMPTAFSSQHSWYSATLSSAFSAAKTSSSVANPVSSSKLLYSYTHVINGFSAHLSPSELEALKNSPGYISSYKDLPVKLDTTRSPKFLGLTSNSGAWEASNYGENVIVGVIDTGIWPESESYSDKGISEIPERWKGECEIGDQFNSSLCNKKLIGARYFNRGIIARDPNITFSMNSTRDTDGHGTHTSSTAAGNFVEGASFFGYAPGTASGVAPKAHVAMYKALWDEGAVTSDIIAAIDQAISDGVDVLSISLGLDGVPLYEDPIALATFSATEKNIFVSTSAGNEGPYLESLHNGIPWVITVAAGSVDREFQASIKLGNGVSVTGLSLYPGNYSSNQTEILFLDTCLDFKELRKVGSKIVVCQDKNGSLDDQFDNLRSANVTAGIFITNVTDLEFYIQTVFPAIFVSPKDGEIIKDFIKDSTSTPAEGNLEFKITNLGTKMSPILASYSSRGPSPSCPVVLKPDIMAPGSLILAAWPQNQEVSRIESEPLFSKFNILSGTSMSCPHVAGVGALLKKAHPYWSPAAIRSAIMTTADTLDHSSQPIKDFGNNTKPASPLDMGSGHVNPNKALDPGLIYDLDTTDYIKLLCALNFTQKQIQTITKLSSHDCSLASLDLNYPSFIAFFNANDSKAETVEVEFHRTVTNVGEGVSTYTANLSPMNGFKVSVVPEKLEFKTKNQKLSYKLVIQGPKKMEENVVFGYLSWVDNGAEHTVKSPIVATNLSSEIVAN